MIYDDIYIIYILYLYIYMKPICIKGDNLRHLMNKKKEKKEKKKEN